MREPGFTHLSACPGHATIFPKWAVTISMHPVLLKGPFTNDTDKQGRSGVSKMST